jgi:voltage-gated potassium channel
VHAAPWRDRLHTVVFEADTRAGQAFDLVLIVLIAVSVLVVMLESVEAVRAQHGALLRTLEMVITVLFTVEYVVRLAAVRRPWRYALSFFGIIDLLAVVAGYAGLLGGTGRLAGGQFLTTVRVLRVLRVFRVLKLAEYVGEAGVLTRALRASRYRIGVFVFSTVTIVVMVGALMYVVEGPAHGFTSIPRGMYWAIVTLTTVGYGDLAPRSDLGQFLASLVMILGYGIIAVPTGIVTAELTSERVAALGAAGLRTQACPSCGLGAHDPDARFCKACGAAL